MYPPYTTSLTVRLQWLHETKETEDMCGRFTVAEPDPNAFSFRFDFSYSDFENFDWKPNYNVAPSHNILVVTEDGERHAEMMRWGLVPFWAKDIKAGFKMINARFETLQTSGAFKHALKRRRCLVVADSFYEWKKVDGAKNPMRIGLKDWELFSFAGLWESWTDKESGKDLHSCTIITCPANDLVSPIHERMPVILPREAEASWLAPTEDMESLQSLLVPYDVDAMATYEVSSLVNSVKNNSPELLAAA
jgi:putative SOS response-associated peptidase YedK